MNQPFPKRDKSASRNIPDIQSKNVPDKNEKMKSFERDSDEE